MGYFEALQKIFYVVIYTIVVGAFLVGVYPIAQPIFDNATVFLMGAIVILLLGVIPIFYLLGGLKDAYEEIGNKNDPQGGFGGLQQ